MAMPATGAASVAQLVKNPPAMQETTVILLGWEDPLEKGYTLQYSWASLVTQSSKESICKVGDLGFIPRLGRSPGLRECLPTSVFWLGESPWTEEPSRLQSMGSQRVRHNLTEWLSTWQTLIKVLFAEIGLYLSTSESFQVLLIFSSFYLWEIRQ